MIRKLLQNDRFFFSILFVIVLILFRKAFTIGFFQDDYFFIHQSQVHNIGDFLRMFSPIRTYSYKPFASEFFYFILSWFHYNTVVGHAIVFITYFIGLVYFYLDLTKVFKNKLFAKLTVFLYAINFTHVFQLYWFATFQETVVFTTLAASFYYYLNKKIPVSAVLFLLALLSKETAVLYAPFLVIFEMVTQKKWLPKDKKKLALYIVMAGVFYLIYRYSLKYVTALDNYKIDVKNYRLTINNAIWYTLWSLGVPNFMPDVMSSIFSPPLPVFQKYLADKTTWNYFVTLVAFLPLFGVATITYFILNRKKFVQSISLIALIGVFFYLFLGPILFFSHKWMVRLMLPEIFTVLLFSTILFSLLQKKFLNIFAGIIIILYTVLMIIGVPVHESSSTYLLENNIFNNASQYFSSHHKQIANFDGIYFMDMKSKDGSESFWGQSKKLKSSLWDQYFLAYYFPEKNMKAYYSFETKNIPKNVHVMYSYLLLK